MELVRGIHNLRPQHRGCAATIGNFDGVHLGHQAVLGQLSERAADLHLPATVITFEPQSREYFQPESAPPRLTRFREKVEILRRYGVDRVLCLRFNKHLASLAADEFIRIILLEGLDVKYLVVGDDFRFGAARGGNFSLLVKAGKAHGFPVVNMHTFNLGAGRVSSTRVRAALQQGDLATAQALLGRPYRMSGRVAHGDKRGRVIGFPTANIHLHRTASPVAGVFAVEMTGISGEPVAGIANIGSRPTVDGTRALLEVHLFDFERDIYGQHVQVSFLHKLREEQRFDSLDALKRQIEIDVTQARDFIRKTYSARTSGNGA
ncbi:MAG: bifunctional riboflavin kinase/FAD synthetase [Gammaproteobacteria bacterium]